MQPNSFNFLGKKKVRVALSFFFKFYLFFKIKMEIFQKLANFLILTRRTTPMEDSILYV